MPRALPFSSANQILQRIIEQYGLQGPMAEYYLKQHWAEVVGEQIASHTQPVQIRFHKLYLSIDSPAWMQELAFLKSELLEKVNAALIQHQAGIHVDEIVLRLGSSASWPSHSSGPPGAGNLAPPE
jgi:predicted nucleic acid-binding Zn ribbon protein